MATQTVYVSGVIHGPRWPRIRQDQMDTKFGENFHCTIYPDEAGIHQIKASGSRVKKNEDEHGTFYKFSRPNKKDFKGKTEVLGPPMVVDKDGNPFSELIGDGSKITVKLSVYESAFGKGTRLEGVRVDELVKAPDLDPADLPNVF